MMPQLAPPPSPSKRPHHEAHETPKRSKLRDDVADVTEAPVPFHVPPLLGLRSRTVSTGLQQPRNWITGVAMESSSYTGYDVHVVYIVETRDNILAYLTIDNVTISNAPAWLDFWLDDGTLSATAQRIHFHRRPGLQIDGREHLVVITVQHPLYEDNAVHINITLMILSLTKL